MSSTAYVKTYYMKKIFIFYIIETNWEQVQTLSAVSIFDLCRMSPCSLFCFGQQTQKPNVVIAALYADVFGLTLKGGKL
jgi:hypothetical protein